jgi:hypothetical protein
MACEEVSERSAALHTKHGRIEWAETHRPIQLTDRHFRLSVKGPDPAAPAPGYCQVRIKHERLIDHGSAACEIANHIGEPKSTKTKGNRVVLAHLCRTPSQPLGFGGLSHAIGCPPIGLAPRIAPHGHAIG